MRIQKFYVIWFIILLLGLLTALYITLTIVKMTGDKGSKLKIESSIPHEYSRLFFESPEKISNRQSYILYNTKLNPISQFYYDNKYWVVVTRLRTKRTDSLPHIIVRKNKFNLTYWKVYAGFDEG